MADENRLNSILCKFDADWMASDEARTEATNDLYFSRVSQWDDWLSNYTTLQYRGQFDLSLIHIYVTSFFPVGGMHTVSSLG